MTQFSAILALLWVACGPGDGGAESPRPPAKVLHVALETSVVEEDVEPPITRVALVITDETGAARREPIGEYTGACSDVSAGSRGERLAPILALDCWWAGAGVSLRFVRRDSEIHVLRATVDEVRGRETYEPFKRLALPVGAAVKTDYDTR